MYKRAQLVCAWGQNWVCTQRIFYSLRYFKAFIQHIFDYIICGIFGAWTPYSIPRCLKLLLAYTTLALCVCLDFLYSSLGLEALSADLTSFHSCSLASVVQFFIMCNDPADTNLQTGKRWALGTNHSLASVRNMDWHMQCSWIINMVLKFKCELC